MNDFSAKWDEISEMGHSAGKFRVYPDHLLDLFLGYSSTGERQFILEVNKTGHLDVDLPIFENIQLSVKPVTTGQSLLLSLLDASLKDLFSVICFDLAEASANASTQEGALGIFITRLKRWSDLLRKRRTSGMSKNERLGLIGELLMLEWAMDVATVNLSVLVRGWRGPEGDTNDLGLNGVRIEIKAQNSTQVPTLKISSLEQLDWSERALFVALHRLSPAQHGISLKGLIDEVGNRLSGNHVIMMEFQRKLYLTGYDPDADYVDEAFHLDSRKIYRVDEGFPRLTLGDVPEAIRKVRYEISLEGIQEFEVNEDYMGTVINGS